MTSPLSPDQCLTMIDVRAGVDAVDTQLMDLLATRFAYMRAAARIKCDRSMVRDEARKTAVIAAARKQAEERQLPGEAIASLWAGLVEFSISYELEEWDRLRSRQNGIAVPQELSEDAERVP